MRLALLTTLVWSVTGNDEQCRDLMARSDTEFKPIRVRPIYDSMFGSESAQSYVTESLMPAIISWIERAIKVRRNLAGVEQRPLRDAFNPACGGSTQIAGYLAENGDNADLLVSVKLLPLDGLAGMAWVCFTDDCGRPTYTAVVLNSFKVDDAVTGKEGAREKLESTLLHEMFHTLGFLHAHFAEFRNRQTMERLDPVVRAPIKYLCEEREDGSFSVRWDVRGREALGADTFNWPGNIVRAINARGLKAEDCRCPVDPNRVYTNADIEYCMRHPNHCAIAVTSPKVVEKAREYYGCDDIEGLELENSLPKCSELLQPHWKMRTLKAELMTWLSFDTRSWVSPMTLALLEDSGWYEVDYNMAAASIPTGSYGYKAGCEFAIGKCMNNGRPVDDKIFCLPSDAGRNRCSLDATSVTSCNSPTIEQEGNATWRRRGTQTRRTFLPSYSYGIGRNWGLYGMDFCPVYDTKTTCMFGDSGVNSRCLETQDGQALCMPVQCSADRSRYEIPGVGVCGEEGQSLLIRRGKHGSLDNSQVVCRDPAVVCADWNLVHFASHSAMRTIPAALGREPGPVGQITHSLPSGRKSGTIQQSMLISLLITILHVV